MMWIPLLIVVLYSACLAGLALWGAHRLVLLWWLRQPAKALETGDMTDHAVLVQVPVFNEPAVVARVIDAVCQLRWPDLRIQILDDSTDHTTAIAQERTRYWARQGKNVSLIHRERRTGFKAGALANGLDLDDAPLVCIFDADFLPEPDFLERLTPFLADSEVGMVQGRWGHTNRDESVLTRVEALALDGHFAVEHAARHRRGLFFNFNGTAGVWRRAAILGAGGWEYDTVTEDLDLSYRAQLAGWRFVYRNDVVAPAELPPTMSAFLTQQHRWAKGTAQTARKLLLTILRSEIPWLTRLEAWNHLTAVIAYPLVTLVALLLPLSVAARPVVLSDQLLLFDVVIVAATTGTITGFYAQTLARVGQSVRQRIWEIPLAMAIGVGCAPSQTLATIEGLISSDATFDRTPKRGRGRLMPERPSPSPLRRTITSAMALYYGVAVVWGIRQGSWSSLPFMGLFLVGFVLVSRRLWLEDQRAEESAERADLRAAK